MDPMTADQMEAMGLIPAGSSPALKKELHGAIAPFATGLSKGAVEMKEVDKHIPGLYRMEETAMHKNFRMAIMKASLRAHFGEDRMKSPDEFKKAATAVSAGFSDYDLQAPAKTLVPWLYPLREALPRVHRSGDMAHWRIIAQVSGSYSRGTLPASPWVKEGARAPQISLATIAGSATYATIGREGSVTFEAESASQGFDDVMARSHFFTMETLFSMEEDALLED